MPWDWTTFASFILVAICVAMLVMSALHDITARTIPDMYWVVIAVAGLFARFIDGTAPWAIALALAVLVVGSFCLWLNAMGAGDVKLLAAVALAVPPSLLLVFLIAMAVAGAVISLPYLAGRTLHRPTPRGFAILALAGTALCVGLGFFLAARMPLATPSMAVVSLLTISVLAALFGSVAGLSRHRPGFLARWWRIERKRLRDGYPVPYACAIAAGGLVALL